MEAKHIYVVTYAYDFDDNRCLLETSVHQTWEDAENAYKGYLSQFEDDEEISLCKESFDGKEIGFFAESIEGLSMGWCRCTITSHDI